MLFNDGHIHLRSETVVVRRWMKILLDAYVGQMIPGDGKNSYFSTHALSS